MNEFKKQCPKCNGDQIYSSYDSLRWAIRKNTICNQCRANEKKIVPENGIWKRICSSCGDEMIYSCRYSYNNGKRSKSICKSCAVKKSSLYANKSYLKTYKYKNKMSEILKEKRKTGSYGEEFKEKCRKNKLKQIENQGIQRTYNMDACKFMDRFNKQFGIKLQHGLNGGEYQFIGYSLDGYDKENNIIFEYDEPKHHITCVKIKDEIRQKRLIDYLHPNQFWRYDEKYNKLVEVINNKEVVCLTQ